MDIAVRDAEQGVVRVEDLGVEAVGVCPLAGARVQRRRTVDLRKHRVVNVRVCVAARVTLDLPRVRALRALAAVYAAVPVVPRLLSKSAPPEVSRIQMPKADESALGICIRVVLAGLAGPSLAGLSKLA